MTFLARAFFSAVFEVNQPPCWAQASFSDRTCKQAYQKFLSGLLSGPLFGARQDAKYSYVILMTCAEGSECQK